MWEAFAYALWFTFVFVLEATAFLLAILMWLLEVLAKATRRAAAWTWLLVLDLSRWRRSPRELAVRNYPQAHRQRPPLQAPPEPPKGVHRG